MSMKAADKNNTLFIAVIGSSRCTSEDEGKAEVVGREIANQGAILVCGGLGGIMEAACKGASLAKGITLGILPGDDTKMANPYVQIPIATGLGEARNSIIIKTADAVIAIAGEFGTLSEIAFALKADKPVIGLDTWSVSQKGREISKIIRVKSAAMAVKKAISLARVSSVGC